MAEKSEVQDNKLPWLPSQNVASMPDYGDDRSMEKKPTGELYSQILSRSKKTKLASTTVRDFDTNSQSKVQPQRLPQLAPSTLPAIAPDGKSGKISTNDTERTSFRVREV